MIPSLEFAVMRLDYCPGNGKPQTTRTVRAACTAGITSVKTFEGTLEATDQLMPMLGVVGRLSERVTPVAVPPV